MNVTQQASFNCWVVILISFQFTCDNESKGRGTIGELQPASVLDKEAH